MTTPTLNQILNPRRVVAYFDFNTGRGYTPRASRSASPPTPTAWSISTIALAGSTA